MSSSKLFRLLVVAAILFLAWKYGIPWVKQQTASTKSGPPHADNSCVGAALAASEAWGSDIHQFVNPPYDTGAWSSFRSDIDSKIATAESGCSCSGESCTKGQSAMRDLRGLVSDLDTSIRTGAPPPGDIVQRQESIDRQIDEAQDLVRSGK